MVLNSDLKYIREYLYIFIVTRIVCTVLFIVKLETIWVRNDAVRNQ